MGEGAWKVPWCQSACQASQACDAVRADRVVSNVMVVSGSKREVEVKLDGGPKVCFVGRGGAVEFVENPTSSASNVRQPLHHVCPSRLDVQ